MTFNWGHSPIVCLSVALLFASGCHRRGESTLEGGTSGTVYIRGVAMADVQVHVFAESAAQSHRIAYGVSDGQGDFHLIGASGRSAVTLPPGQYRFTIESVAADPIPIPQAFGQVATTPLVKYWSETDTDLVLDVK